MVTGTIDRGMKVRLHVKAKSRRTIAEWLEDNNIPYTTEKSGLWVYSDFFVLDRVIAQRVRLEFAQRDMKITEH